MMDTQFPSARMHGPGRNWRDVLQSAADKDQAQGGFADLLAALRMPALSPETPPPEILLPETLPPVHAAAITPDIGSDARAFSASPLLVTMAMAARSSESVREKSIPFHARAAQPATGLPTSLTNALETLFAEIGSTVGTVDAGAAMTKAPTGMASGLPSSAVAAAVTPSVLPAPGTHPPSGRQANPDSIESNAELRPIQQAVRPQTGSCAYHCLPVEGGFRLLVRLIRLPDGLRGELETRLRGLFSEFGLNLRDLDLRESGSGGN